MYIVYNLEEGALIAEGFKTVLQAEHYIKENNLNRDINVVIDDL